MADYYNYYPDHKSIFYDLFDTGWKILKPGGKIVLSFPKNFTSIYGKPIHSATALENFKSVLKNILSRHSWNYRIVKRENMPFIISERDTQDTYDEFIFLVKPVSRTKSNNRGIEMVNMTRKKRHRRRSRKYTAG